MGFFVWKEEELESSRDCWEGHLGRSEKRKGLEQEDTRKETPDCQEYI